MTKGGLAHFQEGKRLAEQSAAEKVLTMAIRFTSEGGYHYDGDKRGDDKVMEARRLRRADREIAERARAGVPNRFGQQAKNRAEMRSYQALAALRRGQSGAWSVWGALCVQQQALATERKLATSNSAAGEVYRVLRSGLPTRQRLALFLTVPTFRRPGGEAIRTRQDKIRSRMKSGAPGLRYTSPRSGAKSPKLAPACDEARIIRRIAGAAGKSWPINVTSSDNAPTKAGSECWFRWKGQWKFAPGSYHRSTMRVEVGAGWLINLRRTIAGRKVAWAALVDGDAYGFERRLAGVRIVTRYDGNRKKAGIAVRLRGPDGELYWEHGQTIGDCRAELAHKAEVARQQAAARAMTAKQERMVRLIVRMCPRLPIRYEDARSVGYCQAGIAGWQERYGVQGTETTAGAVLATGDGQARKVVESVAKRVASERLKAVANA